MTEKLECKLHADISFQFANTGHLPRAWWDLISLHIPGTCLDWWPTGGGLSTWPDSAPSVPPSVDSAVSTCGLWWVGQRLDSRRCLWCWPGGSRRCPGRQGSPPEQPGHRRLSITYHHPGISSTLLIAYQARRRFKTLAANFINASFNWLNHIVFSNPSN